MTRVSLTMYNWFIHITGLEKITARGTIVPPQHCHKALVTNIWLYALAETGDSSIFPKRRRKKRPAPFPWLHDHSKDRAHETPCRFQILLKTISNHVVMEEPRQQARDDEQHNQQVAERLAPAEATACVEWASTIDGRRVLPLPYELLAATAAAAGDVHCVLAADLATPATGSHGTADFQLQAFSQNIQFTGEKQSLALYIPPKQIDFLTDRLVTVFRTSGSIMRNTVKRWN